MCHQAVDICPFVFDSVPDWCKTQEMCDKTVDACLPELNFVHDLLVMNKVLENISPNDVNFDDDLETIINITLMTWCNRFK